MSLEFFSLLVLVLLYGSLSFGQFLPRGGYSMIVLSLLFGTFTSCYDVIPLSLPVAILCDMTHMTWFFDGPMLRIYSIY